MSKSDKPPPPSQGKKPQTTLIVLILAGFGGVCSLCLFSVAVCWIFGIAPSIWGGDILELRDVDPTHGQYANKRMKVRAIVAEATTEFGAFDVLLETKNGRVMADFDPSYRGKFRKGDQITLEGSFSEFGHLGNCRLLSDSVTDRTPAVTRPAKR